MHSRRAALGIRAARNLDLNGKSKMLASAPDASDITNAVLQLSVHFGSLSFGSFRSQKLGMSREINVTSAFYLWLSFVKGVSLRKGGVLES